MDLGETPSASEARDQVLARLVAEFQRRMQAGERLSPAEFAREHPEHAQDLLDLFATIEDLESLAGDSTRQSGRPLPAARFDPSAPIADFRIEREIGRGGMGVVYEAEQISLGRRVALKVLPFAAIVDPRQVERFQIEARAAAHLHHPNIVPVFAVGADRGVHYYAMQYIHGRTLAALIRELREETSPPPKPAPDGGATAAPSPGSRSRRRRERFQLVAHLGIQAAQALDFAHEAGILHRDVKPSNLLIDADGRLWLTDFGLARFVGDASLTLSGDVVGTLRYMSPEQALGKRGLVDQRTDVYSLGATLYELLTLRPAVGGQDREEVYRRIAVGEPLAPRRLDPRIPLELETILLKSMAKRKEDRYETAGALAEELQRYLDGRPILAKRPGATQRLVKWAQRRPSIAAIVALAVLLVAVPLVLQYRHGRDLQLRFEAARDQARLARHRLYGGQQRGALESLLDREFGPARAFLRDFSPAAEEEDLRDFGWFLLWRLAHQELSTASLDRRGFQVNFTADARSILVSRRDDTGLHAWSVSGLRADALVGPELVHGDCSVYHGISPDGRLAAAPGASAVDIVAIDSKRVVQSIGLKEGGCRGLAWLPDALALLYANGSIEVVAVPGGETRHRFRIDVAELPDHWLAASPDGRILIAPVQEKGVSAWDLEAGRDLGRLPLEGASAPIAVARFSPDGRWLAAVEHLDNKVVLWELDGWKRRSELQGHSQSIFGLAFSPDGSRLATAGADRTIRLWDLARGVEERMLLGHDGEVRSVAFDRTGDRLASTGNDRTVKLWDVSRASGTAATSAFDRLLTHAAENRGLLCLPTASRDAAARRDGAVETLLTADVRGKAQRWEVGLRPSPTAVLIERYEPGESDRPLGGTCSADARWCAKWYADGSVSVWCCALDGSCACADPTSLRGRTARVMSAGFAPDGSMFLAIDGERRARVWRRQGERCDAPWLPPAEIDAPCTGVEVAIAADRRHFAVSSAREVWLYDLENGIDRGFFEFDNEHVGALGFSPDSKLLLSGGGDGVVRFWSLEGRTPDGKPIEVCRFEGHVNAVQAMAMSPDRKRLATGSDDRTIRLWDLSLLPPDGRGTECLTLRGHAGRVTALAFSLDGRTLYSAAYLADDTSEVFAWRGANDGEVAARAGR
jgi:serine/threonine protein kinase/WD40 repeat protein